MDDLKLPIPEIFYEKDQNGYYSRCPGFEECETRGRTVEEVTSKTMTKIKEVLELLAYIKIISESNNSDAVAPLLEAIKNDPNSSVRDLAKRAIVKITKQAFK